MYSKPQCPCCEKVDSVIQGCYEPPSTNTGSSVPTVGTFADILQSKDCNVCRFVVRKLGENPASDAYGDSCMVAFWRWSPPNDYLYSFGPVEGDTNCLTCDLDHGILTLVDLELADLDPNWIDLDRVRAWAKLCDTEHSGICHRLTEWTSILPPSLAPLLLVDVTSRCLVEIPINHVPKLRYVALSYVWGQLQGILETTRDNEQDLRQKHALSSPLYAARLPDTVRDAIELVHRLGVSYLWVDRLCIVQDDFDRKLPQLEQMGAIYANAYLTLVAFDGDDANHGLRGSCLGVANPRVLGSSPLTFSPAGKTLVVEPEFAPRTGPGEWYRRGWTFQERTLSNRNLVFQQGRVFWECRGAVWTEELAYGPPSHPAASDDKRVLGGKTGASHQRIPRNQKTKPSAYNITFSRWPDLHGYEILVRTYSELLLSFPSDGLRAFTGIINMLSRSFPGGLLYGIPEYFFDYAIIWVPYTPVHRRLVNGRLDPALPSWSWAGWAGGGINLSIAPPMHQRADTTRGTMSWENIEIYPKIDWHKTHLDTGTNQRINNGYHEAAKMKKDKSIPLPEGWSKASSTQGDIIQEGFVHDDLPGTVFLWPLQVPDHSSHGSKHSFQPYLNFRTSRAFLNVGARLQPAWEEKLWSLTVNAVVSVVSMFHLHLDNGNWAGVLISNGASESLACSHEARECIVVSGGVTWKDANDEQTSLEEWAQVDVIKSLPKYEFYNVLFIEWEQGIAYRKGVGRVWKEAWEQLNTSVVDIILG
ncbi:heterokaryon incompatibility protein-domain-containing protein [Xylaria castorea]|nr:heterokaryon incompatibility protein-domain-containing protein [Xylaria castorea]